MCNDVSLKELLATIHEPESVERAYLMLWSQLRAPPSVIWALGEASVEDLKQECLKKLFVPPHQKFLNSQEPLAYARAAFRNTLMSGLSKMSRGRDKTAKRDSELEREHVERVPDDEELLATRFGFQDALQKLDILKPRQRLAVLLTHAPDQISLAEWRNEVGEPANPPTQIQGDDKASVYLFPDALENKTRRLNSFRKLRKRAYDELKRSFEGEV